MTIIPLSSLPAVNATLNAVCTFFLLIGFAFIRNGKIRWHRAAMLCAFFCSITFLGFYVYFHVHAGLIRFGGQGWIRPVYFTLLVSHTILAITTLPLVIITLAYALSERFSSHRRIAHWTYPIWLYVSDYRRYRLLALVHRLHAHRRAGGIPDRPASAARVAVNCLSNGRRPQKHNLPSAAVGLSESSA
jgi:putative membrane protein